MTLAGYWLLLAPLTPLLATLVLMTWPAMQRHALALAPWSALPALLIALLPWNFATAPLPGLLLGTQIGLDDSGRAFLLLSALVWLIAGLHAGRAFTHSERPGFVIFFLLAMTGNLGVIIASGILSFYVSFALMSFAAYGLVIHERSPQALHAGRIYMVFVVLGEMLLLSALLLAANGSQVYDFETIRPAVAESDHRNLIVLLTITGLGIKIGLLGLHFTLALIYRAAPVPVAAVLAGAMINAGLLGWLRLLPLGHAALADWGTALMSLGLLAAFYGVAIGLTQRDAKTVLAYSSISQMGILTIAVGLGLTAPQAWPQILMVVTLYAIHHGLAKSALFLGVGMAQRCPDTRYWRWLVGTGLLLPALALAGAPLTSGMLAKAALKAEVSLAPAPWADLLDELLPVSALATTLLVARFLYLAWPSPGRAETPPAPPRDLLSWGLLLAASLLLVWFLPRPMDVEPVSFSVWWKSLWPVLVGTAIAIIVARGVIYRKIPILEIPAGDLLIVLETIIHSLSKAPIRLTVKQLPHWQARIMNFGAKLMPRTDWRKRLASVEAGLIRWPVAVTLFLLLILTLMLPGT